MDSQLQLELIKVNYMYEMFFPFGEKNRFYRIAAAFANLAFLKSKSYSRIYFLDVTAQTRFLSIDQIYCKKYRNFT